MAIINDLKMALSNMCLARSHDKVRKQLRRSRSIAHRYARVDKEISTRLVVILDDAYEMVKHTREPNQYIKFVSAECLAALKPVRNPGQV